MRQPQHPRRFLLVALVFSRGQVAIQLARVFQFPLQRRSWSVHAVVQRSWSQPCSRRSRVGSSPRSSQEGQSTNVRATRDVCASRKKRLEEAEQEILEAIMRRDVLKPEVVAGEERLAGLKAELTRKASAHCRSPPMLVCATRFPI